MEERNIDGLGIDTQVERDQINYRPVIEYIKPKVNASYYEVTPSIDPAILPLVQPKVIDIWGRTTDIIAKLNKMESDFSEKLKDTYALVPEKILSQVTEAARKFGYQVIDRKLPFALYKNILLSSDSHEKIILQDAYENYHSDVNGDLLSEIYPDIVEMKQDWEDTYKFLRSGLIGQLSPKDKANDPDYVHSQELKLSDSYVKAKKLSNEYAAEMRKLHLVTPESETYFEARRKYTNQKRELKDLERRVFTKNEVASLIQSKLNNIDPFLTTITNFTALDLYKNNTTNLLYNLLLQYATGQEAEKGLRKVQALLKLSIDGKIESVDSAKTNLRGLSNNQYKRNVNNSLVKSIHIRNEVYGNVLDTVDSMNSPTPDPLFDMVAEHIVDSIHRTDHIYTEQSSDFLKINAMDMELRRDKLFQVLDKDNARRFYQIIDNLVSYAKQRGNWPNQSGLSSWLNDFITHEGL